MPHTGPSSSVSRAGPLAASALRPRTRMTLSEGVVGELREAIIMGAIAPGAPLRLEEVADLLGTSVSPIREALRQLETLGLVEYVPYRGARVTLISRLEMAEVYEIRTALEVVAARRAAERFDDSSAAKVEQALRDLDAGYDRADLAAIVKGNSAFHATVADASGSAWLCRLLRPTLEVSERYGAAVLRAGHLAEIRDVESRGHQALLDACRRNDVNAAEAALREHLEAFAGLFSRELDLPSQHGGLEA